MMVHHHETKTFDKILNTSPLISSHVGSSLILNDSTGSSTLSLDFESLS